MEDDFLVGSRIGLIGKRLDYSYSKIIHENYLNSPYELIELKDEEELKAFMTNFAYSGVNVTNPYKQAVIPYLDALDEVATATQSVNTIVNQNGLLIGYNTDYFGFETLLHNNKIDTKNKHIYLLGDGGVSKTVQYALKNRWVTVVSRHPKEKQISYESLLEQNDIELLINATSVGVSPNYFDIQPSVYEVLKKNNNILTIDLNYNPNVSYFCSLSKTHYNGLEMLIKQAILSNNLMTGRLEEYDLDAIVKDLTQYKNYFIIGLTGSGKTTFGKKLALEKNLKFIDIDLEIEQREQKTITQIFKDFGELYFRKLEEEITIEYAFKEGYVISCGGGIVLNDKAMAALKAYSYGIFLKTKIDTIINRLSDDEIRKRPLIEENTKEKLEELYQKRIDLYELYADEILEE